ncbi:hypothetical protein H632_c3465p0, partial [Helicosporidium sp. ATCC 50920]
GGGGILVPLLLGLFDKDPSTAVALSNITILGGALSNLALNCGRRHPQDSARPLIDWDLSLVMEPGTVLGALVGSYLNRILPTWLTTVGLAALLTVMARKLVAKATDARRRHAREGEGDYLARLDSAGGDVWVRAPSPEYEDDETSLSTVEEGVSAQDALSLPHQNPFSASLLPDHQNSSSASLLPAAGLSAAAEIAPLLPSPFVTPALPSAASDLTFPARPSSSPQHLLTPPTSPMSVTGSSRTPQRAPSIAGGVSRQPSPLQPRARRAFTWRPLAAGLERGSRGGSGGEEEEKKEEEEEGERGEEEGSPRETEEKEMAKGEPGNFSPVEDDHRVDEENNGRREAVLYVLNPDPVSPAKPASPFPQRSRADLLAPLLARQGSSAPAQPRDPPSRWRFDLPPGPFLALSGLVA